MKRLKLLLALTFFLLPFLEQAKAMAIWENQQIAAGSLVLPMDNDLQKTKGSFNLRVYGLVVRLLENNIKVKWGIAEGKSTTDATDFTVQSKRIYPTASVSQQNVFKGGPFIVEKKDAAAAKSVIAAFSGDVVVYETTANVNLNVSLTLTEAPNVALFADNSAKDDLENILKEAQIDNYTTLSFAGLKSTECYSMVAVQDIKKNTAVPPPLATTIEKYVNNGGNFFALNWGIIQFENACKFQTVGGDGYKQAGNAGTLSYFNTDDPFVQIHGSIRNDHSNLSSYSLDNATLKSSTKEIIKDNSGRYKATAIKYSSTSTGGNVYYLSSNHFKASDEETNAARMFLNAVMMPAERPSTCVSFIDVNVSVKRIENENCNDRTIKNEVIIKNVGNVIALNLKLVTKKDSKLKITNASLTGGIFELLGLTWRLPVLLPGSSEKLTISYTPESSSVFTNTFFIEKNLFDQNQDNDTVSLQFEQTPLPLVNAGKDVAICSGEKIQLGEANDLLFSYSWSSKPGTFSSTQSTVVVKPTVTTLYFLSKTNKSTGCTNIDTVKVDVHSLPLANPGKKQVVCMGASVVLGGDNLPGYNYQWSSKPTGFTSTEAYPRVTPLESTTFYLSKTNILTGCSVLDSVSIDVTPFLHPAFAGEDRSICIGTSTILGEDRREDYVYRWKSKPAGFESVQSSVTVSPKTNTYYYLTKTSVATGCVSNDSVFVEVAAEPSIAIAGEDVSTYFDHLFLSANPVKSGKGEWTVLKGSANIKDANDPKTEVTQLGVGMNILQWSVSNSPCVTSTDEVVIEVLELKIPTTISPNGDGVNDVFEITGLEYFPDNVVTVFNRWGNVVFETSGYKNDWSGTSNSGRQLSEDTYFCTVEVDGKVVHKKYLIIKR